MKSSLAVWFLLGFVVAYSSAQAQNDFNILTPEGTYKPGSFYKWLPLLDRIIEITREPGTKYLEAIKGYVEPLETAFQTKDDAALSLVFGAIGPLYKRAQPYILNKNLDDAIYRTGNTAIEVSKRLKTTSMTLAEHAALATKAATDISSALPKRV